MNLPLLERLGFSKEEQGIIWAQWVDLDDKKQKAMLVSDDEVLRSALKYRFLKTTDLEDGFSSLKILIAQLRKDFFASPSINSAHSIGEAIMKSSSWGKTLSEKEMQIYFGDPVTSVNSMIENVLKVLENPTWETLAERGRVQYNRDAATNGWKTIKAVELRNGKQQHNEKFVQLAISYLCCKVKELCPDVEWYAIDTSVSGIPGDGRKPVICLSSIGSALWPQIVTVLELKDVHNNTNYFSAIGQLKDRAETLFLSQPDRSKVLTAYIAKGIIDLVVIENASSEVKHSGVLGFEFDKDSSGLWLFIRMFLTSKINLGFVPKIPPLIPITLKGATVTDLSLVFIAKPMESSLDAENPSPRGTKVYFCKYKYEGITKAAVLKLGRVGKEIANLNKVQDIPGITRLLDTGHCSDGEYLITHPQGTRLNLQMETVDILSAVSKIAMIIKDLYDKHGMLHRDISIGNIIWVNEEKTATLIDWATAAEVKEIHADDQITGTPIFLSIHVHRKNKSNVSTDLESLMFVLMFVATDGHLPWRKRVLGPSCQNLNDTVKLMKLGLMCEEKDFHDWVEPMAWDPDLKRAIRNLRELFFSPEYRTNVRAEEFMQALEDVYAPGSRSAKSPKLKLEKSLQIADCIIFTSANSSI